MEVINNNAASAEEPTVATSEAKTLSRTPSTIKIFTVKSENNKQTSVLAAELQRDVEPEEDIQAEESREASDDTDHTKTATSEEVQNANAIHASAIKVSSGGKEKPVTEVVVEQRDGIEKVLKDYGVPLPDDACWTTVNEETSRAWTTLNDESTKAWKTVESSKAYNEMSNHLTKFNESASQAYNQTVNGLTTAYVMAEEDLSLMGLALTQTKTIKSINELLEKAVETNKDNGTTEEVTEEKKEEDEDEDGDEYEEGEGMEISLTNRIGDTRKLSEI